MTAIPPEDPFPYVEPDDGQDHDDDVEEGGDDGP